MDGVMQRALPPRKSGFKAAKSDAVHELQRRCTRRGP
jgi:hypothetical protein